MTQPPFDPIAGPPAEGGAATDSSPTEAWPSFATPEPAPGPVQSAPGTTPPAPGTTPPAPGIPRPAFAAPAMGPGHAPAGHPASAAATGYPGSTATFIPAPPEPGPGEGYRAAVAPATPATRGAPGASRILNVALGAAIMVGAIGIAFAAGRATAPASTGSVANVPGTQRGLGNGPNGANGGNGTGNGGNAPGVGGNVPNPSFDLNGNGGQGRPGDIDGGLGFDRGLRGGFGGLGISGTVRAVTPDSITIRTDAGLVVTFSLDGTTTYHQQAAASQSDVKTGSKVQVKLGGQVQPSRGTNGDINLGTAGDVTVVP
jgi:hypothetical protein